MAALERKKSCFLRVWNKHTQLVCLLADAHIEFVSCLCIPQHRSSIPFADCNDLAFLIPSLQTPEHGDTIRSRPSIRQKLNSPNDGGFDADYELPTILGSNNKARQTVSHADRNHDGVHRHFLSLPLYYCFHSLISSGFTYLPYHLLLRSAISTDHHIADASSLRNPAEPPSSSRQWLGLLSPQMLQWVSWMNEQKETWDLNCMAAGREMATNRRRSGQARRSFKWI